ncbi:unknown [Candidatus Colimorpha enterica]|uniref:Gram-positive cocci surface proteins LPxTG domain-containing protein n=1 Tax=Candidatus Colimorpha enterica TaxID=3083063 RepID=R6U852_9BACT|nr:unknown [Candidatus Colimorpha enterica]
MKKTLTAVLSLILALFMGMTAFAEGLDISANPTEEAMTETEEGVYEVSVPTHPRIKANLEAGIEFGVNFSFRNHDWININLVNEANFPQAENSYLGKSGVTLLLQAADCSFMARIVTPETSWDAPLGDFGGRDENINYFGNGQWHKVSVSKKDGKWSLRVNGVEAFGELTEAQSAALDTLLGGESGFVSFGCSSGKGFYYVCSGAVADRKIGESKSEAENTTVPATEPPAESTEKPGTAKDTKGTDATPTSAPATEKPSDGGNGGGNTVIYIVAGAVIVIAAAVIIVSLVKKKKK